MLTNTAILLYNDAQRKKAETVVHRMVKRAVEMEGTVTVRPKSSYWFPRFERLTVSNRVSMVLGW